MIGKTFTIVWEELNLSLSPSRVPATKGALELLQSRVPGHKATGMGLALAGDTSQACMQQTNTANNTSFPQKCTAVGKVQ